MTTFGRVLVAAAFFLFPVQAAASGLAAELADLCLFAAVAVGLVFGNGRVVSGRLLAVAPWVLAVAVVTSAMHADVTGAGKRAAVLLAFNVILLPIGLCRLFPDIPSMRWPVVSLVGGTCVSALFALGQAAGVGAAGPPLVQGRAMGLAGHTNILGLMCGVAAVLAVHIWLFSTRRRVAYALGGLAGAGLVLSGSLSSALAATTGVLLLVGAAWRRGRVGRLVVGVVLATVVVTAGSLWAESRGSEFRTPLERLAQTTGQTSDISTFEVRTQTYTYALEQIEREPLAARGLDDVSGASYDGKTLVHNMLIRSWYQGGPALFGFIVVLGLTMARAAARALRAPAGLLTPAPAVMTALWIFALTSASLLQRYFWAMLFLSFVVAHREVDAAGTDDGGDVPGGARDASTRRPSARDARPRVRVGA